MPRPVADFELDPLVVPIPDDVEGDFDDWIASLRRDGPPLEMDLSAADLVAEARDDEQG